MGLENNQSCFLFLSSSSNSIGVVASIAKFSLLPLNLTGPVQIPRFLETGKATYLHGGKPTPTQSISETCEIGPQSQRNTQELFLILGRVLTFTCSDFFFFSLFMQLTESKCVCGLNYEPSHVLLLKYIHKFN